MITIRFNKTDRTYTVSSKEVKVTGIEARSQADCVAMELRNGWEPSFGTVQAR